MTAAAGHTSCRAVIAARNAAVEKIVWQNEGSCVVAPGAAAAGNIAAKRRILVRAVTDTSMQRTVVVTLPEAQARSCSYGINARVESITANVYSAKVQARWVSQQT